MTLVGGAAVGWPLAARAQHKAMPVIGLLGTPSPAPFAPFVAAFRQGLSEIGYIEGQNVMIQYRWAEGHFDRLATLAADLVARKVDVIATVGGTASALAAKHATAAIPIVFEAGTDPVASGLVASLARPGGNATGVSFLAVDLASKQLDLLLEAVPNAKVIALLLNPDNPRADHIITEASEAAQAKGVQLAVLKAAVESEFETAFASLPQRQAVGLVVVADPLFGIQRQQLVALATRHAVPAIYSEAEFAAHGGLMSYGPSISAAYRLAGSYAGQILNGAKPAELPVQQPTKFELVVNLKTAKALGLTVPRTLLARADEVIE
jgi:putative ABC transport system substrate-binding protein